MLAVEGHDDDFTEEGDRGEQHSCLALLKAMRVGTCVKESEPDLLAALHAEGLDLLRHPLLVLLLLLIALVGLVGDVADGWEECVFLVFWHGGI